jgi:hypothetical protein
VKKRAASNYFSKTFDKDSNLGETETKRLGRVTVDAFGNTTNIQYNWPYDFFSLVELVKMDAEIEFNNVDYSNFEEKLPKIITTQAKPRTIRKIDNIDMSNYPVASANTDATALPVPAPIETSPEQQNRNLSGEIAIAPAGAGIAILPTDQVNEEDLATLEEAHEELQANLAIGKNIPLANTNTGGSVGTVNPNAAQFQAGAGPGGVVNPDQNLQNDGQAGLIGGGVDPNQY